MRRRSASRARLHFHVHELARAGLIKLVEERPKGGVIEKFYIAAAHRFRLAPALASGSSAGQDMAITTWDTTFQVLIRAMQFYGGPPPELLSAQHQLRLSPDAFTRVREHLQAIRDEFLTAASQPPAEEDAVPVSLAYLLHRVPSHAQRRAGDAD